MASRIICKTQIHTQYNLQYTIDTGTYTIQLAMHNSLYGAAATDEDGLANVEGEGDLEGEGKADVEGKLEAGGMWWYSSRQFRVLLRQRAT